MDYDIVWPAWLIAAPLTLLFLWLTLRAGRRLRLLVDTPTSKAKGVFVGQVELAGRAVIEKPVRSFLAGCECVWFRFSVEEQWARWETETYTDSKGRSQTRQVRKSGWTTVDEGGATPAFEVEDETGVVRVRPEGAEVEPEEVFAQTVGRGDALYYGKGPAGGIGDSTGRRRFTENAIALGRDVFVAGRAREREDVVAPEIAADPEENLFLISCRGEERVQRGYRRQFWGFGVALLLAVAGGVADPVVGVAGGHGAVVAAGRVGGAAGAGLAVRLAVDDVQQPRASAQSRGAGVVAGRGAAQAPRRPYPSAGGGGRGPARP